MNLRLRNFTLGLAALLCTSAFAQPTPPYPVTISGMVLGCTPNSAQSVTVSTASNTLPFTEMDVPLDPNCGFTVTLDLNSFQGAITVSTPCGGAIQSQTISYTVDGLLGTASIVVTLDCLGQPACNACFTSLTNTPWTLSFDNCSTAPVVPIAYSWMFSDGSISTMANPTWTIPSPGLYISCLSITDMNGCSSTDCDSIFVDANGYIVPMPDVCNGCITLAASNTNPNGGGDPIPYSVDVSNCVSGGTGAYTYNWSFGDGVSSTMADPGAYIYSQPGDYTICLITTDANGLSCWACDSVYVSGDGTVTFPEPYACNAEFFVMQAYEWVADPANPNGGGGEPVPNELWLWNLSACGNGNCQFQWTFGDGTSSTEAYPSHTYGSSGTYELCLTINDNGVCTSSICHNITVDNDGILDGLMGQGNRSTFRIRVMDPLSVGVRELPTFSGVTAWPNPVNDVLNVTLDSRTQGKVNATITDLSGRMVLTTSLGINGGSNRLTLPVAELNPGLYMITISNGSTAVTERFVKVH